MGNAWKVPIGRCGVLLQVVEVRRLVAIVDPVEDGKVQLQQLLDIVEDATQRRRFVAARQLLDGAIGEQVDVELRAVPLDGARQRRGQRAGRGARVLAIQVPQQELAQHRHVVA